MSANTSAKRSSMLGGLSVADRAKSFQTEAPLSTPPARPIARRERTIGTLIATQTPLSPSLPSTSSHPTNSCKAETSSSMDLLPEDDLEASEAVIKHARRISVSTPHHRRASSDLSNLDPALLTGNKETDSIDSSDHTAAHTTHTTSFAEIEALTAELKAKRPRSKTLAHHPTRRGRAGSVLMQSIAEESMHIRLCSSTETIRPLQDARPRAMTSLKDDHTSFQVSPCLSEDNYVDWHGFVSGNYSMQAPSALRHPSSTRTHLMQSALCKDDSPTLNDEATWLEAELAECSGSSDDEDDDVDRRDKSHNALYQSMDVDEDEYVTPEGSPLLSPANLMPPPSVAIMGLGIQDASLLLPGGERNQAAKSADSLLEQVVLLEACAQTLRTLSHDEREQATAAASAIHHRASQGPCTPERQRSLTVSGALRGASSRGDFCATQLDSSALFAEASYDASSSPMADNGHGTLRYEDCHGSAGERRASAASYLSTNSTASADLSIASHGSSLLYNAHLAAPAMIRAGSSDTAMSTRPSSIASSYGHELVYGKPPISPVRSAHLAQPATVKEACETPQPSQPSQRPDISRMPEEVKRMAAMPLPPLPHESAEAGKPRSCSNSSRRASRRKEGTEQPQLPARLDSLDAAVAAAPAETQLKEEFPQRLLGDWMQGETAVKQHQRSSGVDDEPAVSVQPVPLHKRIHDQDGTTYLPGLGEIVPPSPDVGADMTLLAEEIPAYPAARKRLGLEPASSMLAATDSFVACAASGMTKPTGTLKSKLSDRLGLSSSSKDGVVDVDAAKKTERKVSDSSLPGVLGRMRKASAASTKSRLSAGGAELPAAWTDRISVKRPSFDMRRPSLASLTSVSTHSSSSTTASISTSTTAQSRDNGAALLPSSMGKGDARSRSSLGFRKMFSTNSGEAKQPTSDVTNVQALAASAFESPKTRRPSLAAHARQQHRDESFMELSDDEDSVDASSTTTTPVTGAGRKDLTKMFGASEVDLSQPMGKEKRWTALSRSNTTAYGGAKKCAAGGVF